MLSWREASAPIIRAKAASSLSQQLLSSGRNGMGNGSPIPDLSELREWRQTEPFLGRACQHRTDQICGATWAIVPINPDKGYDKAAAKAIEAVLRQPNPKVKNNSFASLFAPVLDDGMTGGVGVVKPIWTSKNTISELHFIDAQRLQFLKWDGKPNSYRYGLTPEDSSSSLTPIPFKNNELITITLNPNSYSDAGYAPLRILYKTIQAWQETFFSTREIQKHRGPSGLVNINGLTQKQLNRMRMQYQQNIEGTYDLAFTNWPMEDVKMLPITSTNILEQGTFQFIDLIIRSICAAFAMSPSDLMWFMDVNRSTAFVQGEMTLDDGVKPTMKTLASYVNTEFIWPQYPKANIQFVWVSLLVDDQPEDTAAARAAFGPIGSWLSINEIRLRQGLAAYPLTNDEELDAFFNEPRIPVDMGGVTLPISFAVPYLMETLKNKIEPETVSKGESVPEGGPGSNMPENEPAAPEQKNPGGQPVNGSDKPVPRKNPGTGKATFDSAILAKRAERNRKLLAIAQKNMVYE